MTHTFKLARRMSRLRAAHFAPLLLLAGACNTDSLEPTAAADADVSFAVASPTPVTISNIVARSGKTYQNASDLAVGAKHFIDREYTVAASLPSIVAGARYIRTANDDKNASPGNTSFLTFDVNADAVVYVGHDNRLPRPSWLTSGFQDTGVDLLSSDALTRFSLFKKTVSAGRVTLGSNVTSAVTDASMYVVIVQPKPVTTTEPDVTTPPPPAPSVPTTPTLPTGTGIPFGAFGTPTSEYTTSATWSGALHHLTPGTTAMNELAAAQKAKRKLVISLAGAHSAYKNTDGTFSMTKWKANIDKWRSVNLAPYITDGTIIGHYLIDEPFWGGSWGGKKVSPAELEEMAKHSKTIWPAMATTVRAGPDYLLGFTTKYIDFAWAQWEGPSRHKGMTPEAWRDQQIGYAKQVGVKLIFGMNVLDGGDGSSKIDGTYDLRTVKTRWQMSAAEVERAGKAFASAEYSCGIMNWRWSSNYPTISYLTPTQLANIRAFNTRADVKAALERVAAVARNRPAMSCKR